MWHSISVECMNILWRGGTYVTLILWSEERLHMWYSIKQRAYVTFYEVKNIIRNILQSGECMWNFVKWKMYVTFYEVESVCDILWSVERMWLSLKWRMYVTFYKMENVCDILWSGKCMWHSMDLFYLTFSQVEKYVILGWEICDLSGWEVCDLLWGGEVCDLFSGGEVFDLFSGGEVCYYLKLRTYVTF